MKHAGVVCGLCMVALVMTAACQPATDAPESAVAPPHEHVLTTLYRARAAGDAFETGRSWLAVDEPARAADAWASVSLSNTSLPDLQIVAYEALRVESISLAQAALQALLSQNPNDSNAHLQLGLLLASVSPDAAAPHLQAAMADPAYAPLASAVSKASRQSAQAVGWALLNAQQWPLAELAFSAAAGAEPQPLVWAGLALSRAFQGKDSGPWMNAAVTQAPNDPAVFALQSIQRRVQGDLEGSLVAQQRAVALAPESAPLLAQLGMAYQRLGDLDEASVWLERAQALAGDDPRYTAWLESVNQSEAAALGALLDTLATPTAAAS